MWILACALLASRAPAAPAPDTPKLDKDAARWLREVHLLILPEEEAVPLAGFALGPHLAKLEVTDGVAGTTTVQEATFEVRE